MERIIYTLYFVLCVLVLPGCSRAEEPDYFPKLSKGMIIEYAYSHYNSTNGETTRQKWTYRVEDEVELGGKRYIKLVIFTSSIPGSKPGLEFIRWAKDGIYQIGMNNDEFLLIQLPIAFGQEWTTETTKTHRKFEGVEDLYLPDRTIKGCLKMSQISKWEYKGAPFVGQTSEFFFAPKIGLVKWTNRAFNDTSIAELVLEPSSPAGIPW
jgi:hypothetical protein